MKRYLSTRFVSLLRAFTVAVTLSVLADTGNAQDLKLYVVGKTVKYVQTSPGSSQIDQGEPGPFRVFAAALGFPLSDFTAISLMPPGGGEAVVLEHDEGSWETDEEPRFLTQEALDAAWPDSATPYTFSFTPAGGGQALLGPITVNGSNYPEGPVVTNYNETQLIDPSQDFTLTWSPYSDAGENDFILVSIRGRESSFLETPPPPAEGYLDGTQTSLTIEANTLPAGEIISVEIGFYRAADRRTTDIPDAAGYALYAAALEFEMFTTPIVTLSPEDHTVAPGQDVVFSANAIGSGPVSYQWTRNGVDIPGETSAQLHLSSVDYDDSDNYSARVTDSGGTTTTEAAFLTVDPDARGTLSNLSNRSLVQSGDGVMIPGFVISGAGNKEMLLRAMGPTLEQFGVGGALADPEIALSSGGATIASNDNWGDATNASGIGETSGRVGAAGFPGGSADSAILTSQAPGLYTLVISGKNATTGVALAEVFDADIGTANAELINLSNRGFVGTGSDIMIPGFVLSGSGSSTLLIRVVGPTLGAPPYNVPGVLSDPTLRLFSGNTLIGENDDWQNQPLSELPADIAAQVGAFALQDGGKDAALVVTLQQGSYTVHAQGADGETGIVLVEIFLVQ